MFDISRINDNLIKQHSMVPYEAKGKEYALEEQNTIVVPNTKSFTYRLKKLFKKK